jgi:hypothetical protein
VGDADDAAKYRYTLLSLAKGTDNAVKSTNDATTGTNNAVKATDNALKSTYKYFSCYHRYKLTLLMLLVTPRTAGADLQRVHEVEPAGGEEERLSLSQRVGVRRRSEPKQLRCADRSHHGLHSRCSSWSRVAPICLRRVAAACGAERSGRGGRSPRRTYGCGADTERSASCMGAGQPSGRPSRIGY